MKSTVLKCAALSVALLASVPSQTALSYVQGGGDEQYNLLDENFNVLSSFDSAFTKPNGVSANESLIYGGYGVEDAFVTYDFMGNRIIRAPIVTPAFFSDLYLR